MRARIASLADFVKLGLGSYPYDTEKLRRALLKDKERDMSESTVITPTVGRVVWFYPGNCRPGDQPWAALVAYVHGVRCVNLAVFDPNGCSFGQGDVVLLQEGDGDPETGTPHARWMPYQLGQAKKAT